VLEPLRSAGHRVEAVDLPGRPGGPAWPTIDMASYVDVVTSAIDRAGEPVVLAVHSLGGVAASLAVESRADAISRVVFVNSLLLNDGEGALDALTRGGQDCVLLRPGALVPSEDGATIFVDSTDTAIDAFYNCCDPTVAKEAASQLVPEPLPPVLQPLAVSAARFGSVPKTYIGAKNDRTLPWALQQQMSDAYSARFVELGGDHSPMLSATDDLLTVLAES
jgi:pimeloyl-ACP methyl ester carboxylesterase